MIFRLHRHYEIHCVTEQSLLSVLQSPFVVQRNGQSCDDIRAMAAARMRKNCYILICKRNKAHVIFDLWLTFVSLWDLSMLQVLYFTEPHQNEGPISFFTKVCFLGNRRWSCSKILLTAGVKRMVFTHMFRSTLMTTPRTQIMHFFRLFFTLAVLRPHWTFFTLIITFSPVKKSSVNCPYVAIHCNKWYTSSAKSPR